MKELGVVLDFQQGEIAVKDRREPMKMLESGHPVLDMDAYDPNVKFGDEFCLVTSTPQDEASEDEDDDDGDCPDTLVVMKKGARKRLKRAVKALLQPEPQFKVMEIWTWTQQVSRQASQDEGWTAAPAVSLETGYDLRTPSGRAKMWKLVEKEQPDLLVLAFPCTAWSPLQQFHKDQAAVAQKRQADRVFVRLAAELADYQEQQGKLFVIENPQKSLAWKLPEMLAMAKRHQKVSFPMCTQGLCDPYTRSPMLKPTTVLTNSLELAHELQALKCECSAPHQRIMGKTWQQDALGQWTHVSRAEFAGGYTPQFAQTILRATRTTLRLTHDTCPVDSTFLRKRREQEMAEVAPLRVRRRVEEPPVETPSSARPTASPGIRNRYLKRDASLSRRERAGKWK